MTGVAIPHEAAPPAEVGHPPLEIPEFRIISPVGLAISGVLLVLLIVAIAVNKLWPLTFFHVAGGAAWTIVDLFLGLILGPILLLVAIYVHGGIGGLLKGRRRG